MSPYAPDARTEELVVAELARAARLSPLPGSLAGPGLSTWADLLFADDDLQDPTEPSQAVLLSLASAHRSVVTHYNALPSRARRWYLEERLGIARLPVLPDRVVLVVAGDPKRLPATLPKGSVVKAGKDAFGGERLYATTEALTVLGARVVGAHSFGVFSDTDRVARRSEAPGEPASPFAPFAAEDDDLAPHELYVASDLLAFTRGRLVAILSFVSPTLAGAAPENDSLVPDLLKRLEWEISTTEGYRPAVGAEAATKGNAVELKVTFTGGSAAARLGTLEAVHLRARFPDDQETFSRDQALALGFRELRLRVEGDGPEKSLLPQAGYYNGGLLDLTKEFQPFGPVPRRGDAFYLLLDEAFGKPLSALTVEVLRKVDGGLEPMNLELGSGPAAPGGGKFTVEAETVKFSSGGTASPGPGSPAAVKGPAGEGRIYWERYDGGAWRSFAPRTRFGSVTASGLPEDDPFSSATEVGGVRGHFVRAFMSGADFGWEAYERQLAINAAVMAKASNPNVTPTGSYKEVSPPLSPIAAAVAVAYTTVEVRSSVAGGGLRLFARNGLGAPQEITAEALLTPFVEETSDFAGTLYLGLADVPPGEVVALYVQVEEADACAPQGGPATFLWEYRVPEGWRSLEVVDGTSGLRQSGLLRFVAPLDWPVGAPDADETGDRWIRARTQAPELAGRIRRLQTDAVEASYLLAAGREDEDPTSASVLPAGAVTGLKVSVPGVKGVANPLPSWGGRGPEPEEAFFARASATLRHRNRAISAWDIERLVRAEFPDVAAVRCLPHHSESSDCAPGWVGLVVIPRSEERLPFPSVRLAGDIRASILARGTPHLRVAVLCPEYEEVSVGVTVQLAPDLPAGEARRSLEADLRSYLHPLRGAREGRFGRPLFRSSLTRFFEEHPAVDFLVETPRFGGLPPETERIDIDPCRGLIASAAEHQIAVRATL